MAITQSVLGKLPEGTHRIEQGLYFRVRGKYRNFFVRLQVNGKRRDVGLGSANEITLAVAKAKAAALRADALSGNSAWGRVDAKPEAPRFKDYVFEVLDKLAEARQWKNASTKRIFVQITRDYLIDGLGEKRIDAIERDDVLRVLRPIWETKGETSKRAMQILSNTFDYAMMEGWIDKRNPAQWRGNLSMYLPPHARIHKPKHHEAPTFEEAQRCARAFIGSAFPMHQAIVFGLLTATRVSEFVKARWDEFDFENRVWSVPPERRKDEKPYPHRVPLSKQAIFLLKRIARQNEYVFKSRINSGHINPISPRDGIRLFLMRAVTMHGCRSAFSDWCAREGIDVILIEKSLMHATGSAVHLAYQRDDLLEQRREVMQRWADALFEGSGIDFDSV